MNISKQKIEKILSDMKECIESFGLPIIGEISTDERPTIISKFQYEHYGFAIAAIYHPEGELVEISIYHGEAPKNKIKPICELMNLINAHIMSGHFFVDPSRGGMSFRAAVHVPDSLNKEEFEWALKQVMGASYRFFPMIVEQLFTDDDPEEIIKRVLEQQAKEVNS